MRIACILSLLLALGCQKNISFNDGTNYFVHKDEFLTVKIPIADSLKFYESDFVFMCPPDAFVYKDTVHNYTIFIMPISPKEQANFWKRSESDQLLFQKAALRELTETKTFFVPLENFISEDSTSSSSLTYHTNWRIDSTKVLKFVEFFKYIQNKDGWCDVTIRREYRNFDIMEDYKWARSFDKMQIIITKRL